MKAIAAGLDAPHVIETQVTQPESHVESARRAGLQVHTGTQIADVVGGKRIRAVTLVNAQDQKQTLPFNSLAIPGGATPIIHLAAHRGAKPVFDEASASFIYNILLQGWHAAGAATGRRELQDVLAQGHAAGQAIATSNLDAPVAVVAVDMGR